MIAIEEHVITQGVARALDALMIHAGRLGTFHPLRHPSRPPARG
ncbi:MAG: hypothetical protein ABSD82_12185 [Solirubrobacteraceae bacterium]|jgi:hypothetical protein